MNSLAGDRSTDDRVHALLSIGFLSVAAAVVLAYANPATGYEPSPYLDGGLPQPFWLGLGLALIIAVVIAFWRDGRHRSLAYLLGGAAMTAVVALPLVRGYYFYGQTDPLIHLGWVRAIAGGGLSATSVLYPGSHLMAIQLGDAMGFTYRRSMLLVVVVLAVLYFVFVPLAVRSLVSDRLTVSVAVFSGFLLLPFNNVSTYLRFHPFSLTLLFLPLVLYLLFRHLLGGSPQRVGLTTQTGFALLVVCIATLIFHPQAMLNLLVVLGAISAYQLYVNWFGPSSTRNEFGTIHLHLVVLTALFFIWISDHWQLYTTIEQTQAALQSLGSGDAAGQIVREQQGSARSIGVGLGELFVKIFAVQTAYFAVATAFIINRMRDRSSVIASGREDVYAYIFYGGVALLPLVVVNFVGKVSTYFFRHLGFGMVFVTVVGAIAIRVYGVEVPRRLQGVRLRPLLAGVLAVALALSLLALFPSPYLYLPNHQVTEAQMTGYERAFENQPPDAIVWFGGVRTTTNRFESALVDAPYSVWSGGVPAPALRGDVRDYYATHEEPVVRRDHYFVVTAYDRSREVDAYRELRYGAADIDAIRDAPGTHRIYVNGEFTLYYIDLEPPPGEVLGADGAAGTGTQGG